MAHWTRLSVGLLPVLGYTNLLLKVRAPSLTTFLPGTRAQGNFRVAAAGTLILGGRRAGPRAIARCTRLSRGSLPILGYTNLLLKVWAPSLTAFLPDTRSNGKYAAAPLPHI